MLSFDITDRNIRVVKGVESNGKIKISSAASLPLEEGLIVNGHVKDVPSVATQINGILKKHKMPDKEAIVSISSNLTIFKELVVPKVKSQDMQKTVKMQMQAELNLDDSYSVTYVIVGEDNTDGESTVRVLATACPYEIVNSYREVFKLLAISLRSVIVGCNCITKVLLADTKIKSKMPLLAVQIDNNFISLNLYEQGQLSFSRFASIDPEDYGNADDYVFQAVNENIFRMLQFHRSRNTGEVIENVILYGDTHDYVNLVDELEKLDLKTSLINVPPQIHGHENLEFSLYANAIGAMFKRDKETEKINLLETELGAIIKSKVGGAGGNDAQGNIVLLGCLLGSLLIAGGIYGYQLIKDHGINNKIEKIDEFMSDPETQKGLAQHEKLLTMREQVQNYQTIIQNAYDAYYSQPVITGDTYDAIEAVLAKTAEDLDIENAEMISPDYANGVFEFSVVCDASGEMVQKLPAQLVANLLDESYSENQKKFGVAAYSGYVVNTVVTETKAAAGEGEDGDEKTVTVNSEEEETVLFNVELGLNPRESAYHPDENAADDSAESEAE